MELYFKKEGNLNEIEKTLHEFGDVWIWIAFDPINKVVIGFIVGRRGRNEANQLLEAIKGRTDDTIPFFTSDDLNQYENAILKVYGIKEEVERTGERGRPRKPKLVPSPDLKYAKIKKVRENGRVVKVETEVVFGSEDDVKTAIGQSPVSKHVNNSFVERNNLTMREGK